MLVISYFLLLRLTIIFYHYLFHYLLALVIILFLYFIYLLPETAKLAECEAHLAKIKIVEDDDVEFLMNKMDEALKPVPLSFFVYILFILVYDCFRGDVSLF